MNFGYILKSLQFDLEFLKIRELKSFFRINYLFQKYLCLLNLSFREKTVFQFDNIRLFVDSVSNIGTLQSSILDFHSDIIRTNLIQRKRPVIIDIGANIGQFANAAKLFFPEGKVVSFEPDPEVFEKLKENTKLLSDIEIKNIGLGSKEEKINFFRKKLNLTSSFASPDSFEDVDSTMQLKVKRLDDINTPEKVDLLKIDVEGFEKEVIQGGLKTLEKVTYLLIELSLDRDKEGDNLELLRIIKSRYKKSKIVRTGRPLSDEKGNIACQDFLIKIAN